VLNRLFHLRCPECGGKIEEDDRYCPRCGVDLDAPIEQVILSKEKSAEYLKLAQEWYDQGTDLKDALKYCDLVIQSDPDSTSAYNLRGLILDVLGHIDDAVLAYQNALHIDPTNEDAKSNLADAELELQKRALASNRREKTLLMLIMSFVGIVSIGCFIAGAYLIYKILEPYVGPKATIVLDIDHSFVSNVDRSKLEDEVQILRERSRSFGYQFVFFEMTENAQIIITTPTSVDVELFTKRVLAKGLLEFVDFGATPISPGTTVATDFDSALIQQPNGTKWHTVMTNAQIAESSFSVDSLQKPAVSFILTPEGKDIFVEYTKNNVGKYLGIVLDKVVISCPVVNQPITDGSGIIQGQFSKEEAENLAAYMAIDPLPIPLIVKEVKQ
jgi:preprotein translocase subunit SecD